MKIKKIELLAPGGDIDSIKAAIAAGADAIYCGLNKFNARDRATNIDFDEMTGIVHLAHKHNCAVFLTLNIIIVESELPALVKLLNRVVNTKIDAIIVQDLGLFYLLKKYLPSLNVHASTQCNTHNSGQIHFLKKLSATRTNLARELNIHEIKALARLGHEYNMETEVFVHGSYCLSFSGLCYISSVLGGRSGNRGRCSQPCRDRYETTPQGKNFPLNLKDNSAYGDLRALMDAGVDSLKIEGRIKKFDYVYTVVSCWKKQLQNFYRENKGLTDKSDLYRVFNRDFSNAFLRGDIHKNMFIDSPRDHSIKQLSNADHYATPEIMNAERIRFYEEKKALTTRAKNEIAPLSIAKSPLKLDISGGLGTPLRVVVKTSETSFTIDSRVCLTEETQKHTGKAPNYLHFLNNFKPLNTTAYYIDTITHDALSRDLFIPFKELSWIKKEILFILNDSKKTQLPIELPPLKREPPLDNAPSLFVLIDTPEDIPFCQAPSTPFFFQLPECFDHESSDLITLFREHPSLIPWFPAVLIGDDYTAAVHFLDTVRPERIVTNNTGIAYEADKRGIPWIAGPFLNIVNSFSLVCLKEHFHCHGAFISNEIHRDQIKRIVKPKNFDLYYSIYHPISLLTSRQCLHHQVVGCEKTRMDERCRLTCERASSITRENGTPLFIKKTKGHYACIYNNHHFLNTDIVKDLPHTFSGFSIDLREIKTETRVTRDKPGTIALFEHLLRGDTGSEERLHQAIHPSTQNQYEKGI